MGRKKGVKNGQTIPDACYFCEGNKFHWGSECGACDGTGSERVRKQLLNVYRAKNGIPLRSGDVI